MAYTDWQPAFKEFLKDKNIENCLEFGLGNGTKFLLNKCETVTSLELASKTEHCDWYENCLNTYKDENNWHPHIFKTEDKYSRELEDHIKKHFINKNWDLVFIDSGVHCRADLVNLCFGHADIIAAHDTSVGHEAYGWNNINVPRNYSEVCFPNGLGTTFWIKK